MPSRPISIVEHYMEQEKHRCGYCKSPDTNCSHGIWAHTLTVMDYQNLVDRGWRRSGSYCYKPTMDQTCCPLYTIKCEALNFKISKSQKKILKKMAKFLKNELKKEDLMDTNEDHHDRIDISMGEFVNYDKHLLNAQQNASNMNVTSIDSELSKKLESSGCPAEKLDSKDGQTSSVSDTRAACREEESRVTAQASRFAKDDSSRTPCKKAKLMRKERKRNKLLAQGKSEKEIENMFNEHKQQNAAKSLEELFEEVHGGSKKLELRLVRTSPTSSAYLKTSKVSYELYKKYQMTIHGDPEERITEQRYIRFLVRSPLQAWTPDGGPPKGYGSFHEQYWLDNELIAVGVLDILPSCVSSVYFFYDPAYSHLSLGTFSSLREVCLVRQLNKVASDLKYYYMGFYIHTCPKMRYKARMKPSKLLCPETYKWFDIEPCLAKLDKEKYSRLNDDVDDIDEDGIADIRKILVLYRETAMPYTVYKSQVGRPVTKEEEDGLKQYAQLVGMKCAQRMLLYRP